MTFPLAGSSVVGLKSSVHAENYILDDASLHIMKYLKKWAFEYIVGP